MAVDGFNFKIQDIQEILLDRGKYILLWSQELSNTSEYRILLRHIFERKSFLVLCQFFLNQERMPSIYQFSTYRRIHNSWKDSALKIASLKRASLERMLPCGQFRLFLNCAFLYGCFTCQKEPRLRSLRLQLWSHVFWKKEPHIWKKCRLAALATLCTFLHGWNEHCPFLFRSATWKKGTFLTEYCLFLHLEALEKLVVLFRGSLHFLSRMRTLNRAAVSRGRWLFLVNIPLFLKKTLLLKGTLRLFCACNAGLFEGIL